MNTRHTFLFVSLIITLTACSGAKVEEEADASGKDADADATAEDTTAMPASPVVLNEITSDGDDNIELVNTGETEVDISGWYVVDDAYDTATGEPADHRYDFADGTALAPGEYLVLVEADDHQFGLGKEDGVRLFDADDQLLDETAWPDLAAEISWCRTPDGTGDFQECAEATFGEPND
ncbi:lamin tail domain-containing protein [Persicimonas caeni]|uniref:Lamin tail domain-containing protein n=1 Tax=Persicimonas caeni TaxID=2292766 RepID=A0A4Y6PVI5_PERCE|nr:lamin tail domain-containing protein [Persicimonas caeni]QDG52342.1 lamin tail domain-containing protein [Persicimonas caeni]QED33564.1 lamin tail domain-containing protein [Persicimonas caeni]